MPRHLARVVHDRYFNPTFEEFQPRTMWSLSNAFTSAFQELGAIPQFRAAAKLGGFWNASHPEAGLWFRRNARNRGYLNRMPLQWTHEKCGKACEGTTNCPGFPTAKDRINMAKGAFEQYAESDGTSVIDFALDVLLFAQSECDSDKTLLIRLAKQAGREWRTHARRKRHVR